MRTFKEIKQDYRFTPEDERRLASLKALMDYWVPGVGVCGLHELVANAMIMTGEKERTTDLRGEPLPGIVAKEEKA